MQFCDCDIDIETIDYCKCEENLSITTALDEFGYWYVCCNCGKPLEGEFHYYNHYDGEDHDDIDLY